MLLNILCLVPGKWITRETSIPRTFSMQFTREIVWISTDRTINRKCSVCLSCKRMTINCHLDHWSISLLISSWLITSQLLFTACLRWSMFLNLSQYTSCWSTSNSIMHGFRSDELHSHFNSSIKSGTFVRRLANVCIAPSYWHGTISGYLSKNTETIYINFVD